MDFCGNFTWLTAAVDLTRMLIPVQQLLEINGMWPQKAPLGRLALAKDSKMSRLLSQLIPQPFDPPKNVIFAQQVQVQAHLLHLMGTDRGRGKCLLFFSISVHAKFKIFVFCVIGFKTKYRNTIMYVLLHKIQYLNFGLLLFVLV